MGLKSFLARRLATTSKWPMPAYVESEQPHFLFILTPPHAGSTALSKMLNTSHRTMLLHDKAEGQWLVPGIHKMNRWSPRTQVDYQSVKAVWLKKFQEVKQLVGTVDVVIEKSPPNMMRIEQLAGLFEDVSFLVFNRNPYANCSSILCRTHGVESMGADERKQILERIASNWVIRTRKLESLAKKFDMPVLTYEQFCDDPGSVVDKLTLPVGVAESIDPRSEVKVKDYPAQKISNQNERQISRLSDSDIDAINGILRPHLGSFELFEYGVLGG